MATSVAPRITAWRKTHANLPGPLAPGGVPPFAFPTSPQPFRFSILVDGSWLDITHNVRYDPTVQCSRGRADESQRPAPGRIEFAIDNTGGIYSPRNPTGPYFGLIGRNTPVRVSVGPYYRFHGEVVAWPAQWNKPGTDVWVDVEAAGIMRRLGQGAKPLRSPLSRWHASHAPLAWWPMETGLSSGLGAAPMSVIAAPAPDAQQPYDIYTSPNVAGSAALLDLTRGVRLDTPVPVHAQATGYSVETVAQFEPDGGGTASGAADVIRLVFAGAGTLYRVAATVDAAGNPTLQIVDSAGASTSGSDTTRMVYDGLPRHWELLVYEDAGELFVDMVIDGEFVFGIGSPGVVLGALRTVIINESAASTSTPSRRYGQVAVYAPIATLSGAQAATGYTGETAAARIERLCTEEGIGFTLDGPAADTALLGPQRVDTLLNVLHEAADADAGILYEPRDALGLAYRTRTSLYNRVPALELDYSAADLFGGVFPVDDDQRTVNDVEAKRTDGGSARYTVEDGPLSIQDPPDGVGVYDVSETFNVHTDEQLLDIASARAHIGTFDEARYPQVTVALHSPDFDHLTEAVGVDVGDLVTIANPPAWLPPDLIELLVQGVPERFNPHTWTITFTCVPYGPYRVFRIEGGILGHLAPAGQTLNGAHASDAVELSVTTASGFPLFSEDIDDYPVDVMVAGERITVGFVVGSSSPQLLQVTRSVNGVVKALPAGSQIKMFPRVGIAR